MRKRILKTIIIGAGPAGLNAARNISDKDNTMILEAKPEIGVPVRCGEGISVNALVREDLPAVGDYIRNSICCIKRVYPSGLTEGKRKEYPYAVILDRRRFEKYLSQECNVNIKMGCRVTEIEQKKGEKLWSVITASGEEFKTKHVIAADGPASIVRKRYFKPCTSFYSASGMEIQFTEAQLPDDECIFYFGESFSPLGYAWWFPLGGNRANIGVVSHLHINTNKLLNNFAGKFLQVSVRNIFKIMPKSGFIPSDGWVDTPGKDNLFLVGDAGGFVDPVYSGGISLALLTGRLAAEAINQNISEPDQVYNQSIGFLPVTGKELNDAFKKYYYNIIPAHEKLEHTLVEAEKIKLSFDLIWDRARKIVW